MMMYAADRPLVQRALRALAGTPVEKLTVKQAAAELGVTRRRVQQLIQNEELKAERTDIHVGVLLIDPEDLEACRRERERRNAEKGGPGRRYAIPHGGAPGGVNRPEQCS
jgi:excisionase family DNA binding protein